MDNILLANNEIIKLNLNTLKERSFITLKFIYPMITIVGARELVYFSLKLIILKMILDEEIICKEDAYAECREYIPYEFLDYKIFNNMFYKIKRYAETGKGFDDISDNSKKQKLKQIFFPIDEKSQQELRIKMINFEINYNQKKQILPQDKIVSSEIRLQIFKLLLEKKVLEKSGTIILCRKTLEKDFDFTLFEENWRYFENVFLTKKS